MAGSLGNHTRPHSGVPAAQDGAANDAGSVDSGGREDIGYEWKVSMVFVAGIGGAWLDHDVANSHF